MPTAACTTGGGADQRSMAGGEGAPVRIGDVIARRCLALSTAALLLSACGNAANTPATPPTAQEILNKPDKANVKDAHFTLLPPIRRGSPPSDAPAAGSARFNPSQPRKSTIQPTLPGTARRC